MQGDNALEKTTRINVLFDFYGPLLTEKQMTFLKCYFHDDYSLGEIAADFEISRQAVYEHLKRARKVLEDYEEKLGLVSRHERLQDGLQQLEGMMDRLDEQDRTAFQAALDRLKYAEM